MNTPQVSTNWNPERIDALISQGKGEVTHWFPEGVSITTIATTLVGMANARGGTLLFGITPRSGVIQGVEDVERIRDCIFQAALSSDPPLVLPLPRVVEHEGTKLVVVIVPPGLPQVYCLEGRYFGRHLTKR